MPSRPLLGNHQRCWIWGRNLVRETLWAGLWRPYVLHLSNETDQQELQDLAGQNQVTLEWESNARLAQRCGADDHQGVIAKMPPFPYASADDLLKTTPTRLIIADHLQDPFNFGAIIRVADCFGATGIIIPRERQVGVTSQVARASAGAVNHLSIARTDDLVRDILALKTSNVRIIAASEHAGNPLSQADLSGPIALVIGNEGAGVSVELLKLCDLAVSIPITSPVGSLNAAVAAGIVLYEISRVGCAPQREGESGGGGEGETRIVNRE